MSCEKERERELRPSVLFPSRHEIAPIIVVPTLGIQMIALSAGTLKLRYHVVRTNRCSIRWNATRTGLTSAARSVSAAIKYRIGSDKRAEN